MSVISQNIIKWYLHAWHISEKRNWWHMKNVDWENYTISKIYRRVKLQRHFSPGITSVSSGPLFLGSNARSATYCLGDLEKHPALYDILIPHYYIKWGKNQNLPGDFAVRMKCNCICKMLQEPLVLSKYYYNKYQPLLFQNTFNSLKKWFSNCGSQTHRTGISWELRNTNSWTWSEIHWIRNWRVGRAISL